MTDPSDIWAMNADGTGQANLTNTATPVDEEDADWEYVYNCAGRRATIIGTDSGEKLKGTKRADVIVGNGGKDKIKSKGGNDRICGGAGKDKLVGGKGSHDRCVGGPGHDIGNGCEKGKL
jgi:Ca2+-binding RTX toxin-like protein